MANAKTKQNPTRTLYAESTDEELQFVRRQHSISPVRCPRLVVEQSVEHPFSTEPAVLL